MLRRLLILACLSLACATAPSPIELDLTQLDAEGLRGPADGKVALSYEFKIPDTPEHRAEVSAIDPTVTFMGQSPGRIGAGEGECLSCRG